MLTYATVVESSAYPEVLLTWRLQGLLDMAAMNDAYTTSITRYKTSYPLWLHNYCSSDPKHRDVRHQFHPSDPFKPSILSFKTRSKSDQPSEISF